MINPAIIQIFIVESNHKEAIIASIIDFVFGLFFDCFLLIGLSILFAHRTHTSHPPHIHCTRKKTTAKNTKNKTQTDNKMGALNQRRIQYTRRSNNVLGQKDCHHQNEW